jgi:hypothetical protein
MGPFRINSHEKSRAVLKRRNILVAAILVALVPVSPIRPPRAATYYISSSDGSDSNNALSPQSAWKNLDKIYLMYAFWPGDHILLRGVTFGTVKSG